MNCRGVRESLTEYIAGRPMPARERERVARHLTRCGACDDARREMEAVFALLADAPEPPEPPHGEAIARLAVRTTFAPGPLRANEASRRREDLQLGVCSIFSLAGTALVVLVGMAMREHPPRWAAAVARWAAAHAGWAPDVGSGIAAARQGTMGWDAGGLLKIGSLGRWALLVLGIGALAAILPALILGVSSPGGRRARKEV
jgi:hypothetical protein